jgi:hypothetical protein
MIDWISAFAVLGQVVSTMRSLPSIFSGQVEGLAAFPTSCVYPEFVKATVRGFAEGAWQQVHCSLVGGRGKGCDQGCVECMSLRMCEASPGPFRGKDGRVCVHVVVRVCMAVCVCAWWWCVCAWWCGGGMCACVCVHGGGACECMSLRMCEASPGPFRGEDGSGLGGGGRRGADLV